MNTPKTPKGFTLIELLVVIAVIAVLLAILMPALRRAKDAAKNLVCRTNMKSMSLAFRLYANDSSDKPPLKISGGGTERSLWISQISNYLENVDEARYCPVPDRNPITGGWSYQWIGTSKKNWTWNNGPEPEQSSYGFNSWFYYQNTPPEGSIEQEEWDKNRWSTINPKNSANVPVFADSIWVSSYPRSADFCPDDLDLDRIISPSFAEVAPGGEINKHLMNRHRDRINIGFIDGHAGSVQLKHLWSLKWSNNFQTLGEQTRPNGSAIYQVQAN